MARGQKAHRTQKTVGQSWNRGGVERCGVAKRAWIMEDQVRHTKEFILNPAGNGPPVNQNSI